MGGRANTPFKQVFEVIRKIKSGELPRQQTAAEKADAVTYGTGYLSSGLGQVGETEEKAKKDKNKSNTISKKKYGTRGTTIPLQSTKTISGDGAAKGVQI